MLHVGGAQHLAHRAEVRQPRGTEAAFENYLVLRRVIDHPFGKPARFFIRPEVELRSLGRRHQSLFTSNVIVMQRKLVIRLMTIIFYP